MKINNDVRIYVCDSIYLYIILFFYLLLNNNICLIMVNWIYIWIGNDNIDMNWYIIIYKFF